jgi:adenosylhomocysteine nucleosidase
MNLAFGVVALLLLVSTPVLSSQNGAVDGRAVDQKNAPILVVTAVDYEYVAVRKVLSDPRDELVGGRQLSWGLIDGATVAVVRAGWGKAHASGATALSINLVHPRIVVMAGMAGGLDESKVRSGDVVIAASTFQHDLGKLTPNGLEIWTPEDPLERALPSANFSGSYVAETVSAVRNTPFVSWRLPVDCECEPSGTLKAGCASEPVQVGRIVPRVCSGVMATGDAFVTSSSFAQKMASRYGAVTVDMESAAVAQEANNNGLPFVGIRIISDSVGGIGGESLYYCLKPYSGPRLSAVMAKALPALVKALAREEWHSGANSSIDTDCGARFSETEKR